MKIPTDNPFVRVVCFDLINAPETTAGMIQKMANDCSEHGLRIARTDCPETLEIDGKTYENKLRNKIVFKYEKLKK